MPYSQCSIGFCHFRMLSVVHCHGNSPSMDHTSSCTLHLSSLTLGLLMRPPPPPWYYYTNMAIGIVAYMKSIVLKTTWALSIPPPISRNFSGILLKNQVRLLWDESIWKNMPVFPTNPWFQWKPKCLKSPAYTMGNRGGNSIQHSPKSKPSELEQSELLFKAATFEGAVY